MEILNSWVIIVIVIGVCVILNSFFHLIKDIIVAKHVAENLEILSAIISEEDNEEEEQE